MKTIKELYKIGKGPSSSHTMGPEKACRDFQQRHPADAYRAVLHGSLSMTGRGHLTDRIIKETLVNVEVVFSDAFAEEHPNTLDLFAFDNDREIASDRYFSIGGGDILRAGEASVESQPIYPHRTFEEIVEYCRDEGLDYAGYIRRHEGPSIDEFLQTVFEAMETAVDEGLHKQGELPGALALKRKARSLHERARRETDPSDKRIAILGAYAFAVGEENASGGTIVTAPTCGASGVLPAVLLYARRHQGYSVGKLVDALAVAGLFGNFIKTHASISGAEAGCQAEVGSACAMAAAAHAHLRGHDLSAIEYAAEVALEHHLGLTCDPVMGYVQIPCIERNAAAALRAVDASRLAAHLSDFRKITFDYVVETMYETGRDLPAHYRETGMGGLAKRYKLK